MTDKAIEAMARAIMCARPNGGCIVADWQREAKDNPHVETALNQATAALAAYHAHLAAEGQAIVPVEPTPEMVAVFDEYLQTRYNPASTYQAVHTWNAMLAARPQIGGA